MQSTYLLKLTVHLRIQFVSVSPVNVGLDQTRSLGLKVWGETKHFFGVKTSDFIILFKKKNCLAKQNLEWLK